MNTLNIYDQVSKGRIQMVKYRKNSKYIKVSVDVEKHKAEQSEIDNYKRLIE